MAELLENVLLPSRGKYNAKLARPITIDMLDFECEKLVFGSQTEEAIDEVLRMVVKKPEDFDPLELTEEDRRYLLWQIRIHSYGDQYHGYYVDDNGNTQKVKVSLDNMVCKTLPDDYKNPSGTLPKSKVRVELKEITTGEMRKIEEYCQEKAEKLNVDYSVLRYEAVRVRRLSKVNGKLLSTNDALDFLQSLTGVDLAYIDWLYSKVGSYGYQGYVEESIGGKMRRVSISMNGEFFRPDFDDWVFEE